MSIQSIKDRIPNKVLANGAIRYGVYDENGNLIRYEYIKREDEPLEVGTPVNKALFENLQGDLYTQDRYNIPTYSGTAMSLNLPLSSYEVGKVVKITSPVTASNGTLNINELGNKSINGKINAGENCDLVYNGESWDINNTQIIVGSYTGNGSTSNRSILLGFKPRMLFVWGINIPYDDSEEFGYPAFCQLTQDNVFTGWTNGTDSGPHIRPDSSMISIASDGFTIIGGYNTSNKKNRTFSGYNATDTIYHYKAIR